MIERSLIDAATATSASRTNAPTPDIAHALRDHGLRYVDDSLPGISRRRTSGGFRYVGVDGRAVRDEETLARIRSLAIPPAYEDVWICPLENGHLQATGRDARGRKQYRYHPQWRELRDNNKYDHVLAFGRALPRIRRRIERDLRKPPLSRDNVMATVVRLLESTLMRVGNEEYARANQSFGITTLRDRHVQIRGDRLLFTFRGKSGIEHRLALNDRRVARIVKRCRELPGQELFQYLDADGQQRAVSSGDVNAYLREISGEDFTAKDFRTWAGTVLAAVALCGVQGEGGTPTKAAVVDAIKSVAKLLGNTPAVCRRCYVHPEVIEAHLDGTLLDSFGADVVVQRGLHRAEHAVLELLRRRRRLTRKRSKVG